ncbi:MAG: hypothetical protein ABI721_02440 [Candidatus Dojkabacteria bacterium]
MDQYDFKLQRLGMDYLSYGLVEDEDIQFFNRNIRNEKNLVDSYVIPYIITRLKSGEDVKGREVYDYAKEFKFILTESDLEYYIYILISKYESERNASLPTSQNLG